MKSHERKSTSSKASTKQSQDKDNKNFLSNVLVPVDIFRKYHAIANERRQRFHELIINKDKYHYSNPTRTKESYQIEDQTVSIPVVIRTCSEIKDEPTLFYIKTLMPGTPTQIRMINGDWNNHRKHWDLRIAKWGTKMLFHDAETNEKVSITDSYTHPYLGGVISPRQLTTVAHTKMIKANTLEVVSCSVEYPESKPKADHILAESSLFCHRIEQLDDATLKKKYGIPKIELQDGGILKWSKCDGMLQMDIKGMIPVSIYEAAMPKAMIETYTLSREYLLRKVLGVGTKRRMVRQLF